MACSTRPGPQALIHFVEEHCEVKFSQEDWHSLRTMAEESDPEYAKSRRAATEQEIYWAVNGLASAVAEQTGANIDAYGDRHDIDDWLDWDGTSGNGPNPWSPRENQFNAEEFTYEASKLVKALKGSKVTVGSLTAIGELGNWGIEDALEKARKETVRRNLARSASNMSDTDLLRATEREHGEWVRKSGPLGPTGSVREVLQARLKVFESELATRGLKRDEIVDVDKQAALDALDQTVARERKRMGLPPITSDAKAS